MYTGEGKRRQMIGIGHVVKMGRRQVGVGVSEKKKNFQSIQSKRGSRLVSSCSEFLMENIQFRQ